MSLTTPINSVIFSHDDGARLGVEHLVQHGHQQIALLSGPHFRFGKASACGLAQVSGTLPATTRCGAGRRLERDVWFQQTMHMLNNGNLPTAMLVANDQMALGAMRAISEFGLRVAVDISVVATMTPKTAPVTSHR